MNWVIRGSGRVNNPLKNGQKIFLDFTLTLALTVGFSSCRPSVNSACGRLPVLQGEIQAMKQEMNPYIPLASHSAKSGRKPASVRPISEKTMPRDEWMAHAEDWIKMSQDFRDALHEDERANRKALVPLNEASLQLVTLHGYIGQNKIGKAIKSLGHVEKNLSDFAKKTCNGR